MIKLFAKICLGFYFVANAHAAFLDRASFEASIGASITDTFSDYGATTGSSVQFNNVSMQAVKGETRFEPLVVVGLNLIGDYRYRPGEFGYCAGCNGNFILWFDATSLTQGGGVFGVGIDILLHTSRRVSIGDDNPSNPTFPGQVRVTFANGDIENYLIPADVGYYAAGGYFFGISDLRQIRSVQIGTESPAHFWLIDNLTIASAPGSSVPTPSTSYLLLTAILASAGVFRRNSQAGSNAMPD